MQMYDRVSPDDIVDSSETLVETIVRIAKGDQDINELLGTKKEYVQ